MINKWINFVFVFGWLLIFLWFGATVTANGKHLLSPFFRFITIFLFFSHSGESIYDSPLFKNIL